MLEATRQGPKITLPASDYLTASKNQAATTSADDHRRFSRTAGRHDRDIGDYLLTGGTTAARPGLVEVTGGTLYLAAAHRGLVWLSSGMRPAGHRGVERLKRGLPSSK